LEADRFSRALSLFDEACALNPGERAAFLAERCGSDAGLRAEVEAMLASDARQGSPITVAGGADLLAGSLRLAGSSDGRTLAVDALAPGGFRGRYRLIRVLGEGGMGTVYEAEQLAPRRRVALKAIRRGAASADLLRRFEHEAHVLGRLHHSGIAQIFEAGPADPARGDPPFFAMELVDGPTITDYASGRRLTLRQRIELMIRVCDAVQHAHQRGVIHRDLKPSNILIAEGAAEDAEAGPRSGSSASRMISELPPSVQPKVLDFGVARSVGADNHVTTMHTISGQLVGTLAYMSPEQIAADPDDVDTRTDIYALGVILHQLLTGRLPHDLSGLSLPEAVRVIRDETPDPPRTGNRDVDTIILRAMSRDRERRYPSAAALAADLTRFLGGEPIDARRDSALYVLRKQVSRYRGVVAAAGALVLLLGALAIVASVYSRENLRLAESEAAARRRADAQSEALRRSLYFSQIGFAQAALLNNDVNRVVTLLDSCPPDLRGWEWRYLMRLRDRSDFTIPCSGAQRGEAGLSADGRRLAYLAADRSLVVCDLVTRSVIASRPAAPTGDVNVHLAMSPDGRVVALHAEAVVRLLSSDDLTELARVQLPAPARDVAFSPDGARIATVSGETVARFFDARSGAPAGEIDFGSSDLIRVQFSPIGDTLASLEITGEVQVRALADGREITRIPGSQRAFSVFAYSPDGTRIAIGIGGVDVRVCDAQSGELLCRWETRESAIASVDFHPGGNLLLTCGSERFVQVREVATGRLVDALRGHQNTIAFATFTRDGDAVVSIDSDQGVKRWTYPPAPDVPAYQFGMGLMVSFEAAADGSFLIGASVDGVARLDLPDGRPRYLFGPTRIGAWGVALTPDERTVFSTAWDRALRVTGADSGWTANVFPQKGRGRAIDVRADGGLLAAGDSDGLVVLWDTREDAQVHAWPAHTAVVYALAFRPGGATLLTGGDDGFVRLWSVPGGEPLWEAAVEGPRVASLAYSPDGSRFAAGDDQQVQIWDADSHGLLATCRGHRGSVESCAFSPDGTRLVSGGADRTVRVWEVASGQEILAFYAHDTVLRFVTFTADGTRILSADRDGVVRVWEAPNDAGTSADGA